MQLKKDVWIFNQTTTHAASGLIIHIMIWLGVGQDIFCGSVCRLMRTLTALQCTQILSSERGAFCRGDGSVPVNPRPPPVRWRRILVDPVSEQVQVYKSCDHVKFPVKFAYGSVVRVHHARVALDPSDRVLRQHPCGVDQVVVPLLSCSQSPVVLVSPHFTW